MSDDLLNEIDDIAREMTAGDPPSRMRARVMARIARPSPGGFGAARRRFRGAWVWAPIGAAAAVALAIYLMPAGSPDAPTIADVETPRAPAVPPPPVAADPVRPPTSPAPAAPPQLVSVPAVPPVSGFSRTDDVARLEFEPLPIELPPLEEAGPIALTDLASDSILLEPLEEIAPIAVHALNAEGDIP
jgi:hypothetical protein